MCGRFSIAADVKTLERRFHATMQQPLWPHYNAAPTQWLPIITNDQSTTIRPGKWGLRLSWLKAKSGLINARAESLRERPTFRKVLQRRRCLVLADGFFEWRRSGDRQPYRYTLAANRPFAFAGIWEPIRDPDGLMIPTFAIITTAANPDVAPVHHRMPVILQPDEESVWLDSSVSLDHELSLLHSYAGHLTSYPVSQRVNSVANDTPDVIRPI